MEAVGVVEDPHVTLDSSRSFERQELRGNTIRLHKNSTEVRKPVFVKIGDEELLAVARKKENTPTVTIFQDGEVAAEFTESGFLGRGSSNDVIVRSSKASRAHASIRPIHNGIYITDLGSSNGTKVTEIKELPHSSKGEYLKGKSLLFALGTSPVEVLLGGEKYVLENHEGETTLREGNSVRVITIPENGLGYGDITFGRSSKNNVISSNAQVSREHARIIVKGSVIEVVDLDSSNGTVVRVERKKDVQQDDWVKKLKKHAKERGEAQLAKLRRGWERLLQDKSDHSPQDYSDDVRVNWGKTSAAEDRIFGVDSPSFFEEQEINVQDIPERLFHGRRLIGRDRPINGGVYVGGSAREAIVVDDREEGSLLQHAYEQFATELGQHNLSNQEIVDSVYEYVMRTMPYNESHVNQLLRNILPDERMSLETYLYTGGVCRHQALFAGYLLEKLIHSGRIGGQVSVDRNYVLGKGGHGWARYTARNGQVYIIDAAQGYHGKLDDVQEGIQWFYRRPEER